MSNNGHTRTAQTSAGISSATGSPSRWIPVDRVSCAAIVTWILGLTLTLTLDDPRLRYPSFGVGYGLSALGWLALVSRAEKLPMRFVVIAGVGLRLWALSLAPAFSEDVFRYVYEGRLVWFLGPGGPFAHPPAAGPTLGLPGSLFDEAWLRINHPEIRTIYPPLAQLVFASAGGLGLWLGTTLVPLKGLLLLADLGTWWLLARALRVEGRSAKASVVWGACPLVILEFAREGHADSLSTLGLSLGILGFVGARPRLGYLGWALAALAKLNGLFALPVSLRATRRGAIAAFALCGLLVIPWLLAGGAAGDGLQQYATRWRAGDGVFSLLLQLSEVTLGGPWARVLGVTVTQHQLARAAVAFVVAGAGLWSLRARPPERAVPARVGHLLLLLLLVGPTLHPWYITWLLPFAAAAPSFAGRRAVLCLAALGALLHHPGWLELIEGEWRDLAALRAVVHLPVWTLWAIDLVRSHRAR